MPLERRLALVDSRLDTKYWELVSYGLTNPADWTRQAADHRRFFVDPFIARFAGAGIDIPTGVYIHTFEEQHGALESFAGLLYHPGSRFARDGLVALRDAHPTVRWGFISTVPDDYEASDVPIFTYTEPEEACAHFFPGLTLPPKPRTVPVRRSRE